MRMMQRGIDYLRTLNVVRALAPAVLFLVPAQSALAQNEMEDAAALGACATCSGIMILIPIAFLALSIYLLIWVNKDAKARGLDNAVVWMIVVFLFNLLGFAIYLFSRPQGELVVCSSCGNKRLQASATCPTCGNA